MPEGDTIYRAAAALRAALLGKAMRSFEAHRLSGVTPSAGSVIERVDSHGKHLEIGWEDGVVLHTHMRMTGSWHLYRRGELWRKPTNLARVVIETDDWEAVCFSAPMVETYRETPTAWHPRFGRMGPDFALAHVDVAECVGRIARFCDATTPLSDVLLDQRIACGIGNVYKCETLWMCSVDPATPIGALDAEQQMYLLDTAARLLRSNLDRVDRETPGAQGGLAVYGRFRKPCHRCAGSIEVLRHGEQARVTYWCPGCQVRLGPPVVVLVEPRRADRWFGPPSSG